LIKSKYPSCNITEIEKDINKIFEEYKNKDFNLTSIRKRICHDIEEKYKIKWPNESDLSDKLAREMFPEKEIIICNGAKDLKTVTNINRPTTETTLIAFRYMTRMEQLSGANFCFVSSQPHCKRQIEMAKTIIGSNVTGCERAASNARPNMVLESLLGEINSLTQLKSIEQDNGFWQIYMDSTTKIISDLTR